VLPPLSHAKKLLVCRSDLYTCHWSPGTLARGGCDWSGVNGRPLGRLSHGKVPPSFQTPCALIETPVNRCRLRFKDVLPLAADRCIADHKAGTALFVNPYLPWRNSPTASALLKFPSERHLPEFAPHARPSGTKSHVVERVQICARVCLCFRTQCQGGHSASPALSASPIFCERPASGGPSMHSLSKPQDQMLWPQSAMQTLSVHWPGVYLRHASQGSSQDVSFVSVSWSGSTSDHCSVAERCAQMAGYLKTLRHAASEADAARIGELLDIVGRFCAACSCARCHVADKCSGR
jgi:hypothetical protein